MSFFNFIEDYKEKICGPDELTREEAALLCEMLARLVGKQVSLIVALELVRVHTRNRSIKRAVESLLERINAGTSFADAVNLSGSLFPRIMRIALRAGAGVGETARILEQVGKRLRAEHAHLMQVKKALYTPFITGLLGISVAGGVLFFFIPHVESFFHEMDKPLPEVTQRLLFCIDFLYEHGVTGGLIGGLFILVGILLVRQSEPVARWWSFFLYKIPCFGYIRARSDLLLFLRTWGLLLSHGMPVAQALEQEISAGYSLYMTDQIALLHHGVTQGSSLAQSFARLDPDLFPPLIAQLLGASQGVGELPALIDQFRVLMVRELEKRLIFLISLLPVLLLSLIGCALGLLICTVYIPLFSILSDFSF